MITNLKIKNWRSHSKSEFNFGNGTNVLIGIMGAGKSSIMDALCFGLYGTCPSLQQRKLKIEDLVMRGESTAEVELELKVGGDVYSVRRLIEKGRVSTSEIRKNGIIVEAPQTSKVTENIISLLKMDYDLFVRAVYAEQNSLDHFLTIPKGQRMKKLDSLLRLDKFEKARSAANNLANKLSDQIQAKISIIERLEEDESLKQEPILKDEILQIRKQMLKYQEERKDALIQIESLRERIRNVESRQRQLNTLQSEKQFLESSLVDLDVSIKSTENTFSQFTDLVSIKEKLKEEVKKLKTELDIEKQELEYIRTKHVEKRAFMTGESRNLEELQRRIAEMELIKNSMQNFELKTPEEFKARLESLKAELSEERRRLYSLQRNLEEVKESLSKLKKETCPICDTHLGKEKLDTLIEKRNSESKRLASEIDVKIIQNKTMEKIVKEQEESFTSFLVALEKIKDHPRTQERLERSTATINEVKLECTILEENIDSTKKVVDAMARSYEEKREELTKLEWLAAKKLELDEKISKRSRFQEKLRQTESDILTLNFDPSELIFNRKALEEILVRHSDSEARIDSEQKLLNEKEKRLAQIDEKKDLLEKAMAELNNAEFKVKKLRLFGEALEKTQITLRQEFVTAVNVVTSEVWKNFYPYGDYSDVRLAIEEGDYILQILSHSGWVNVEGVASGGERNCAALSLRIAFALVLAPNLRWLILDEPTHNLDAKAIELLSEVLRDKIAEYVDQVFLITHEPRLEDAVSGVLYRLERPENKNSPTKAVRVELN